MSGPVLGVRLAEVRGLLVAIAVVAAADLGVRWWTAPEPAVELPSVSGFDPAQATTIRLGRVDEPIVLERGSAAGSSATAPGGTAPGGGDAGGWRLTAPIDAPADPVEVDALLAGLAGGVRPEAEVADGGDLAPFGLEGGSEVRVDVAGAGGALVSLVVGSDAGDGGTFVRLPDDDRVYRARIGGRSRYDRPPRTLVDRRVAVCAPAEVQRVTVGGEVAERSGSGWTGLDSGAVGELVAGICGLRGEVADPARVEAWDLGEIVLEPTSGDPIALRLGRAGELRFVGNGDRVWRVGGAWVDRVADPATFADRGLWTLARVDRIALRGRGREGELVREGEGWVLRRPANVDLDPARAEAVAAFLARPRVLRWERVAPGTAGLPGERLVVRGGGREEVLEIGATTGDDLTWVRSAARPDAIGLLDARTARALLAVFGG